MNVDLRLGDCLDVLPTLAAASVDAIITDLPYGTTQCAWDSVIPFGPLWYWVRQVLKPTGVFVTTASQPFTSALVMSNLDWFRQELIWDKVLPVGFLDANRRHMRVHENILVFSPAGRSTYNPKMTRRGAPRGKGGRAYDGTEGRVYGEYGPHKAHNNLYFPKTILEFSNGDRTRPEVGQHPTQKPVPLFGYLIDTFTNAGALVLDLAMGSGTTGVACVGLQRDFIGVERDATYFEAARRRIEAAQAQLTLPLFT